MLYGISGRFQTLSRTVRQVAHALLTRPPLTQGRSPSSVRLECVMHAASVHPEPGSNSRKICIKTSLGTIQSFELDCSLLFCLSSILFKNCEICFTHGLDLSRPALYSSLVVQFSMIVCHADRFFIPILRSLDIISLSTPFVNTFFEIFSTFLKKILFSRELPCGGRKPS